MESRRVANDYTIQWDNKTYQIAKADIRAGLRGASVRVEARLDGSLTARFRTYYLTLAECQGRPKVAVATRKVAATGKKGPRLKSRWMENFHLTNPDKAALSAIPAAKAKTNSIGRPGKSGPAVFAFTLSENRCSETSPKQLYPKKTNPPERAALGPV